MRRLIRFTVPVALALPLAAQAPSVLVVDESNGPGTEFTQLQAAIDAAAEGDLLLLRPGSYTGTVNGKSLVMQGESYGVELYDFRVVNLGKQQSFAMRNCDGEFMAFANEPVVRDCEGAVFIEDGTFHQIRAVRSDNVILRRFSTHIGPSLSCESGLYANLSNLCVYDSYVVGLMAQEGGFGTGPTCDNSGPGITLRLNSLLYLHGSTVRGAYETTVWGSLVCPTPAIEYIGNQGVVMQITDSTLRPGSAYACPAPPPVAGTTPSYRAGTARRVETASPVLEGQTTTLQYYGDPGDLVYLAWSPRLGPPRYYPVLGIAHAPLSTTRIETIGVIPASGVLVQTVTVRKYPGPAEVHSLYLQGFFVSPSGERQLGAPTQVHVLDPSY